MELIQEMGNILKRYNFCARITNEDLYSNIEVTSTHPDRNHIKHNFFGFIKIKTNISISTSNSKILTKTMFSLTILTLKVRVTFSDIVKLNRGNDIQFKHAILANSLLRLAKRKI